ncbi:MAG: hypothetical protein ACRCUS_04100, partial [Anaerovoracaceae bacterium]
MNFFQRNAKYLVILAVICGSTSGIFGKLITASAMTIGFYRLSMVLPFFIVSVLLSYKKELKIKKADSPYLNVKRKDILW